MHYSSGAFALRKGLVTIKSKKGQKQLGNTNGLSTKDKKQAKLMYGCV